MLLDVRHKILFGIVYNFLLKQQMFKYKVANYLKEAIVLNNSTIYEKKNQIFLLPSAAWKQPAPKQGTDNDKSH